jgi:hypothetical protein
VLLAAWWTAAMRTLAAREMLVLSFFGGCVSGYAVISRPSALVLLPVWLIGMIALVFILRKSAVGKQVLLCMVAANLLGNALPILPQLYINNRTHHEMSLVHSDQKQLWDRKLFRGVQFLKCVGLITTFTEPVGYQDAYYDNPLLTDAMKSMPPENFKAGEWYADNFARGIGTVLLHLFCLVDQDLLFGHTATLHPWWRSPLSVINHAMLAFAAIGLTAWWRRSAFLSPAWIGSVLTTLYLLANMALYSVVMAEMRYGLPIILAAAPLAFAGADAFRNYPERKHRLAAIYIVLYVIAALALSDWIQLHAPLIRNTLP